MAKKKLAVPKTNVVGSRGKEVEVWQEPHQVGENGTMLKVTATVDAVKCTFKVSTNFTTQQFHIYAEEERVAMLQKLNALLYAAGEWAVKRCQYWNEQHLPDDDQIGMDFPNQENEES